MLQKTWRLQQLNDGLFRRGRFQCLDAGCDKAAWWCYVTIVQNHGCPNRADPGWVASEVTRFLRRFVIHPSYVRNGAPIYGLGRFNIDI